MVTPPLAAEGPFAYGLVARGEVMTYFDLPDDAGTFDAHALWHACTIPLGFVWYTFIEQDKKYMRSEMTS